MLALFFRTIDATVCPYIALGTHFLWHTFVAVVLYLAMRALLGNWQLARDEALVQHENYEWDRACRDFDA